MFEQQVELERNVRDTFPKVLMTLLPRFWQILKGNLRHKPATGISLLHLRLLSNRFTCFPILLIIAPPEVETPSLLLYKTLNSKPLCTFTERLIWKISFWINMFNSYRIWHFRDIKKQMFLYYLNHFMYCINRNFTQFPDVDIFWKPTLILTNA